MRWLFAASILIAGLDAAANAEAAHLVGKLQSDANLVTPAMLDASDLRVVATAVLDVVVFLVGFGFLIAWTSRAYKNLPALGVGWLRYSTGWAVGGWFVPFLNLVRPKSIIDDIWRATDPDRGGDVDWHRLRVHPIVHWWWGLWIVGWVLSLSLSSPATDPSTVRSDAMRACVVDVVYAVACALAIVVVTRLTESQESRAKGLDTDRTSRWEHAVWIAPTLAVAVFGAAFAGFAWVDDNSTDEERRSAPSSRSVMAFDLVVGDCFEDPAGWSDPTEQMTTVLAVNVLPCVQPHDDEVVGRVQHPADADAPYPGDAAVMDHADTACLDAFERWIAEPYAESHLELGYIWPQEESWDAGERTILCLAFDPAGPPLVGSVRDSGA